MLGTAETVSTSFPLFTSLYMCHGHEGLRVQEPKRLE